MGGSLEGEEEEEKSEADGSPSRVRACPECSSAHQTCLVLHPCFFTAPPGLRDHTADVCWVPGAGVRYADSVSKRQRRCQDVSYPPCYENADRSTRPCICTRPRHEKLRNRVNLYRMKEQREISPSTFAHLASSTLYEKRCGGPLAPCPFGLL